VDRVRVRNKLADRDGNANIFDRRRVIDGHAKTRRFASPGT
jgi:hypothetical protein